MNEKEILLRIVEKIKKNYQTQKIIVFGSYAWGRPTKDSDVDLFIIKRTKKIHRERALQNRRLLREENALIGMDIIVYMPEEFADKIEIEDSFLSKIIRKGEVWYS